MPTLFRWNLVLRHNAPLAIGIVSEHPKLTEGTKIHTSPILQASETEDGLVLKTASGSIYHLKAEEWSAVAGEEESLDPELLGLSSDFWTRCSQARENSSARRMKDLKPFDKPGTLFLRIVETRVLSAFWIGIDPQGRSVPVMTHLGMLQDSYMITDMDQNSEEPSPLDFCLFPKWNHLEPYKISPNLKTLLVCNEGHTDVTFGFPERKTVCAAGTVTQIPARILNRR